MVDEDTILTNLPDRTFLAGYRGSIANGTYRKGYSDTDIMSVHFAPVEHYIGFGRKNQTTREVMEDELDIVSHEIRKFFRLLRDGNPNVVSLLWLPRRMIVKADETGHVLRRNRDMFLSKKFYPSFMGYAQSLKDELFQETYEGFAAQRRKADREEYGFDTKVASECIRLLKTGIELFNDGKITYPRPEARYLSRIKNGGVPLGEVLRVIETSETRLKDAAHNTDLPPEPDEDIEEFLMDLIEAFHFYGGLQHYGW